MNPKAHNVRLAGRTTSPGLVIGRAYIYVEQEALAEAYEIQRHQVDDELHRIEQAVKTVRADLRVSARRIEARTDEKLGAIFQAHELMLQDEGLRREIHEEVERELISATQALARVFRRWERKFRDMTHEVQQQRAEDVADLGRRLLREMAGVKTTTLEKMPTGRVLVARRLLPSDTVALPRRAVVGIVMEFGGSGSHAALLARALGIPTVAQIPNLTKTIGDHDTLVVDGFLGEVILNPDANTRERYRQRIKGMREGLSRAKKLAHEPACTLDGTAIAVMANVGWREDAVAAEENGADGVGLYRLEQFYLARKTPATAQELIEELRATFAPLQKKPITVRLLDLGGDKPLPFLKLPPEDNPFLGQRGVRLLLRFPDLLDTQLKALLELSRDHDVRILVPMVTLADEMAQIRRRLEAITREMGVEKLPPLGAMIETPAAALTVGAIIQQADFLSIGTNDLTQYTMAASRENGLVSDYFVEDHPAVLRLVRLTVEEAGQAMVAVCGELAGRLDAVPTLLRIGVRAFSVAPPLVPGIKEAIRKISLSDKEKGTAPAA
jgi:phosphoenolpyruvate-protein phosphotransferase